MWRRERARRPPTAPPLPLGGRRDQPRMPEPVQDNAVGDLGDRLRLEGRDAGAVGRLTHTGASSSNRATSVAGFSEEGRRQQPGRAADDDERAEHGARLSPLHHGARGPTARRSSSSARRHRAGSDAVAATPLRAAPDRRQDGCAACPRSASPLGTARVPDLMGRELARSRHLDERLALSGLLASRAGSAARAPRHALRR